MNCLVMEEDANGRYLMFVRCPTETQSSNEDPGTMATLNERISKIEENQGHLVEKVDALTKRMEEILQEISRSG